jgi:hypothetical protein
MTTPNSITVTALSLINAAAQEIGTLAQGEALAADDQAWVLQKLQRVIDTFNAKRTMVYANNFTQFTLVPNLAPHTIGPTGTFQVAQRPVEIPTIGLLLVNTTPAQVEIPLTPRDKEWWADQRVKNLTSVIPTDYYYEPEWPNGSIYFWPVPSAVNNVLIQQRGIIAQMPTVATMFTMPPAYWDAIVYTVAVALGPSFERQISPDLRALQMDALRAVQSNNIKSPRGSTGDAGMPGNEITAGLFDYYSGTTNNNS